LTLAWDPITNVGFPDPEPTRGLAFSSGFLTKLLEVTEEFDQGKNRGLGVERLGPYVTHNDGLGVFSIIVDVGPRGDPLEQFETIVGSEETQAAYAWVVDQFFALVGGAVDPLGDRMLFGFPVGWFLCPGDGAGGGSLDFFDGLGKHDDFFCLRNEGNDVDILVSFQGLSCI
jgi:hypothetical protein